MLVQQEIESFLGGVSKAPPWRRRSDEVTEQINALPSRVRGLVKRPPMALAATLDAAANLTGASVHPMSYGDKDFWVVFPGSGDQVRVFDAANGTEYTVNTTGTIAPGYLNGPMRCVTVGRDTYMANTEVVIDMMYNDFVVLDDSGLVWFKQVTAGETYNLSITHGGGTDVFSVTPANTNTTTAAASLAANIDAHANYIATSEGSVVRWEYTSSGNLPITEAGIEDAEGGQQVISIFDKVNDASYLPPEAPANPTAFHAPITVLGDPSTGVDDYYVVFDGDAWVETTPYYIQRSPDPVTMPHLLTYNPGTNDFSLSGQVSWGYSDVGDETTNPNFSVNGESLDDIFFTEGRLGLLSGNKVVLSRSGEPTSFWRDTVRTLRDSAPIDFETAPGGATGFHSALEWNERVYLFARGGGQYVLSGDPILTPRTASVLPVSRYRTFSGFRPTVSGDYVFFVQETNTGETQVLRWTHPRDRPARADDLTKGLTSYIQGSPVSLAVDDALGFLALATDDDPNALYVFFYEILSNGETLLSNWSKWELPANVSVIELDMYDGVLSVLMDRGVSSILGTINVREALTETIVQGQDLGTDNFTMTVEMTPIYMRDPEGYAMTGGRLTVQYVELLFGASSTVSLTVAPEDRASRVLSHTGTVPMRVPIRAQGPKTTLTLTCTGTNDCSLSGMRWEGDYSNLYRPG